jgi:hypothetical protein
LLSLFALFIVTIRFGYLPGFGGPGGGGGGNYVGPNHPMFQGGRGGNPFGRGGVYALLDCLFVFSEVFLVVYSCSVV